MASKPETLCELTPGKLLSSFNNFCSTFNWLVSCMKNLRGDGDSSGVYDKKDGETPKPLGNIKITGIDEGEPVVSANGIGGKKGTGEITITGTDGESVTGSTLVFAAEEDSNVTVKAEKDATTGVITVKIGVYYK